MIVNPYLCYYWYRAIYIKSGLYVIVRVSGLSVAFIAVNCVSYIIPVK